MGLITSGLAFGAASVEQKAVSVARRQTVRPEPVASVAFTPSCRSPTLVDTAADPYVCSTARRGLLRLPLFRPALNLMVRGRR